MADHPAQGTKSAQAGASELDVQPVRSLAGPLSLGSVLLRQVGRLLGSLQVRGGLLMRADNLGRQGSHLPGPVLQEVHVVL